MRKIYIIAFTFITCILFLLPLTFIHADVANPSVHISPFGVIEAFTVPCTGTDATVFLFNKDGYPFTFSEVTYMRRACVNGFVHFDSYNLADFIASQGVPYPEWKARFYHTPLTLIVKDTTTLGGGVPPLYQDVSPLLNAVDFYRASAFFPEDTVYPTLAVGSSFDFDGIVWKDIPPPQATVGNDSVLFLPGIQASRLYRAGRPDENGGEVQLWEPTSDQNVKDLNLDENGKPNTIPGYNIYTRDVIDEGYISEAGPNIYKSFLDTLEKMKSVDKSIADYSAVPYDWRLSLDDILNGGIKTGTGNQTQISYTSTSSDPYILSELRRLVAGSKSGKVTIVAHSNGGLVAKALLKRLADTNDPLLQKIDKVILVAVPQLGTPAAIAADLHGKNQGLPTDLPFLLSEKAVRDFVKNSPAGYNLLPDQNYFTYVDTPVVTFDPALPDWISRYGNIIHSTERLHNFVTDSYGRVSSSDSNLSVPDSLRDPLLTQAENLHTTLDNWQIPAEIPVVEIAGWGVPSTISGINYTNSHGSIHMNPITTIDGDGTVVTPSALWSAGASTTRYWVDLNGYNNSHWVQTLNSRLPFDHKSILEVSNLDDFLRDTITKNIRPLDDYKYISTEVPASTEKRLSYSLHSPLTLNLYDSLGNHTGISTTTGKIEEQIPGTYFEQYGDDKYIFTNTTVAIHVVMNGYASGTFTFNVNQFQGDTPVASTTFKDIPTATTTQVNLDVASDITTLSPMKIDSDGNGTTDKVLVPKLNDVVTLDSTAPVTTATTTGTKGKNNWYTSNVTVRLNAVDTESGIASTTYSLNNGLTWLMYSTSTPIVVTTEGTTTLVYYSTDTAGNREATSSFVIKIDKTAPEASIVFDPTTQALRIVGIDALSSTTVISTATSSLITDVAGHTLQIVFTQLRPKIKAGRIDLALSKLVYDGIATTTNTSFRYKWVTDKNNKYTTFAMHALTNTTEVEEHYRPKKDVTIIMIKPVDIDDNDGDDDCDNRPVKTKLSGMVIVGLKTNGGNVGINY